jgi:hypothetical protein
MNSDHNDFEAWLDQADDDDVEYALRLIQLAKSELIEQEHDLLDEVSDVSEAKELLDRIKIGVNNS